MCRQESKLNRRHQGGVIIILLGLAIAMLIGFAGLAIDLGRFFVIKTEIQNAVDACALSAASQLRPGQNNNQALIKAVAYGRVFSTGGAGTSSFADIKNLGNFQSTVIDITDITFSRSLTFPDLGVTFDTAKYVKCAYPLSGIPILFMKVQDPTQITATVSASAVATQGPSASVCAIPVGICAVSGQPAGSNFGLNVGQWYTVIDSAAIQGWTGWINFPNAPNSGAAQLKNLLTTNGQCDLTTSNTKFKTNKQGVDTSVAEAWDSRFGWYQNLSVPSSPTSAPPDFSGFAYSAGTALKPGNWPAGANAWTGTHPDNSAVIPNFQLARSSHLPFQTGAPPNNPQPPGISINNYQPLTSAQHVTYGKNRRIAVAPVLDCTNAPSVNIKAFACVLMLNPIDLSASPKKGSGEVWDQANLEFLGLSTTVGSVCSSGGGPGTAGAPVPVLAQ